MKRRNFVKQSIAGAIVAATPLALTGLVRAEGGGGTGSTSTDSTDWWGDTTSTTNDFTDSTDWSNTTTEETTISTSSDKLCEINFKQEYLDVKTNAQGAMVSAVCWYPVSGCDNPSTCGETSIQRTCNINPTDDKSTDELVECLNLPQATCPIKCSKGMK